MKRLIRHLRNVSWRRWLIYGTGLVLGGILVAQLIYPVDKLVPGARVDGISVGGMKADDAVEKVQEAYYVTKTPIYFGDETDPYKTPDMRTLGVTVDSRDAVDHVRYHWWLRLIPTSMWWSRFIVGNPSSATRQNTETIRSYVTKELGSSCRVAPKNASVTVKDNKLTLVAAKNGGSCELDTVIRLIGENSPSLQDDNMVRVPMKPIEPEVKDIVVQQLIDEVEARLASDKLAVMTGNESTQLDATKVRTWLTFTEQEGDVALGIDTAKATETLNELLAKKVARAPGTVTITTRDFVELSRTGGGEGAALNVAGTAENIVTYLKADTETIPVAITTIAPQKKYIRSYSATDTGLSALIKNYADTHSGVYGVSLIELSGQGRRAGYNETRNFFPASTYKLFVAYSVLRRVEAGQMSWDDQITGGRNLRKCFDDMIVLSDNACPEELNRRIGYAGLNSDLAMLGLTNTRFIAPGQHRTTAADLATFMASLQTGQLSINSESRNIFLSALKRNIYRKGVPSGVLGVVANKVGFIDALLHDAAIVYAPSGTYVLTIMTDGSSWANIADLAKQIESLRTQ